MELLDNVAAVDDRKDMGPFGLDGLLSGQGVDTVLAHQVAEHHRGAAGPARLAVDINPFLSADRLGDEIDRLVDLRQRWRVKVGGGDPKLFDAMLLVERWPAFEFFAGVDDAANPQVGQPCDIRTQGYRTQIKPWFDLVPPVTHL